MQPLFRLQGVDDLTTDSCEEMNGILCDGEARRLCAARIGIEF